MIVSASLVQTNGWQRSLQPLMNAVIDLIRSSTELKVPRRMAWRVMIPKKISTMFSHDPDVGVKCKAIRGLRGQPGLDGRVFVGGVVVTDQMQLLSRVGLRHLLEELQELLVAVSGQARLLDPAGRDFEGGEQGRGAVPHVVVGGALGQPRADRQDRRGPVQRLDLRLLINTEHDGLLRLSRPGARCRRYRRSVSPGRSPNPACASPRTGLSTVTAVKRWLRWPRGWGSWCPGSDTE